MGVPTAAAIFRAVRRVVPTVSDVTISPFAYHCVISMREEFDGQAKQALLAALGAEPSYVKTCTVVDDDVNIYDPVDVAWAVATRSGRTATSWFLRVCRHSGSTRTRSTGGAWPSTRPSLSGQPADSSAAAFPAKQRSA